MGKNKEFNLKKHKFRSEGKKYSMFRQARVERNTEAVEVRGTRGGRG